MVHHLARLELSSGRVRQRAADALTRLGPPGTDALAEALGHPSHLVRWEAARALGCMGRSAGPVVPALARALDKQPEEAEATMLRRALYLTGSPAELAGEMEVVASSLERELAGVLARFGEAAIPALVKALEGTAPHGAAQALGVIGRPAAVAVPALVHRIQRLGEDDNPVHESWYIETGRLLAATIGKVGDRKAVPLLVPLLRDGHDLARTAAAKALGALGPLATGAIPSMVRAIQNSALVKKDRPRATDKKSWQRHAFISACISAIGQMGPAARTAVPTLAHLLAARSYPIRADTADALGKLGAAARPAIPAMLAALEHALGDCAGRLHSVLVNNLVQLGVSRDKVKLAAASASTCGG